MSTDVFEIRFGQNVNMYWVIYMIDWLVFNVQRAIFQLYSGREHLKIETPRDSKQGKVMGRDG